MADLWTCPECGRSFANRNQWHSCTDLSLDEFLADGSTHAVAIYHAVQAALAGCGEFRIHAQKTRVAFINRMTFAGMRLRSDAVDVSLILPEPYSIDRVTAITLYGQTTFEHLIRVRSPEEVDRNLSEWLCNAWTRGTRQPLKPPEGTPLVTGLARRVLTIPLATHVVAVEDALALRLPDYAWMALGDGAAISAKIPRHEPRDAIVEPGRLRFLTNLLQGIGLGDGDSTDVVIRPRD